MENKGNPFIEDDAAIDAFNPFARFVLPPLFAIMLLAGGVYWIKQLPAGPHASEVTGTVQVRLLPTPEVTPIPLPISRQSDSVAAASAVQGIAKHPERDDDDGPPDSTPFSTASVQSVAEPNIDELPVTVSSPPNHTAAQFQQALMRHIERFQHYPYEARRSHMEGTVQIAFVMGRDGKILDAWVRSSSGRVILDQEAVDALRRAEPLPKIPGELPNRLSVLLPVSFAAP
jgi:protein TonB